MTQTIVDPIAHLADWTRRLSGMFASDLKALDEKTYNICPGGRARTVADITAEVVGYNKMVAAILRGEQPQQPTDEQRAAFVASMTTTDVCVNAILSSGSELADAIAGSTMEGLSEKITMPWGEEMTKYAMAQLVSNHILYHDAQLNYIQSLNGDDQMHWFE
jgi:hypothetical protein